MPSILSKNAAQNESLVFLAQDFRSTDIVEQVKNFVEEECKRPSSHYGYEPFENHFIPTVKYARQLAVKFGADLEIVTVAAWIHDIGSIMRGRVDHHITGARITERKLRELGYPEDRVQRVKKCVFNHRGSQKHVLGTLEEQIVAEADAMSAFDNIAGLFKAAYIFEHLTQNEAKASIKKKLEDKWQQLKLEGSKETVKSKYDAIMLFL